MAGTDQLSGDESRESGFGLCSDCQGLDLREDKFILRSVNPRAPLAKPQHGGRPVVWPSKTHLTSGNGQGVFSSLETISERSDKCVFCRVLWRAVNRYSGSRASTTGPVMLAWELDGRRAGEYNRVVNRTRRIRISWPEVGGKLESICIILVGSPNDGHNDFTFLGREAVPPQEKLDLIRRWIEVCAEKHGSSCADELGTMDEFERLVQATYFGVIDVLDMQLKPLPLAADGCPEKYVALSYVWGDTASPHGRHITTRVNVMSRIQPLGLIKDWAILPKTIQDAMLLVRAIGQRYLWVDSLCIVQDSTSSWELNAKAMHLIYGNAYFTICAADGDATTGLRSVRSILSVVEDNVMSAKTHHQDHSRSAAHLTTERLQIMAQDFIHKAISNIISFIFEDVDSSNPTPSSDTALGGLTEDDERYKPLVVDYSPVMRLLVSRPPETVIQDSSWDERGWTFQERLLSRKCLIFAEGQTYFQCRSTVMSQDKYSDSGQGGWSLDWTNSPLRTLGELKKRAFWFYMKCVGLYTGRRLTKPRDILKAFQGSAWLLEQYLKAPLLFGMPRSHFDLALLWVPTSTLCRRKSKHQNIHDPSATCSTWEDHFRCNDCLSADTDFGPNEFPSWSWSGWMHGKCEYEAGMLDGCLSDVQAWLKYHTWILWYVRDQDGDLRPLWDKTSLQEDISEEDRWRGYSGHDTLQGSPVISADSPSDVPRSTKSRKPDSSNDESLENESRVSSDIESAAQPYQDKPAAFASPEDRPNDTFRSATSTRDGWVRRSNQAYLDALTPGYYGESDNQRQSRPSRFVSGLGYHARERDDFRRDYDVQTFGEPHYLPAMTDRTAYTSRYGAPPPPLPPYPVKNPRLFPSRTPDKRVYFDDEYEYTPRQGRSRRKSTYVTRERIESPSTASSQEEAHTYDMPGEDIYGRPTRSDAQIGNEFTGILPDNPFGVNRGPFSAPGHEHAGAMPVLQFWTFRHWLYVSIQEPRNQNNSNSSSSQPGTGLCNCDIRDSSGDWCGVIKLPRPYAEARLNKPLFFVALSDAKGFTAEECPVWNYYITKEREDSEWDVYFVLLLERNNERALWERVALGKVFKAAFGDSKWDEIKLG